MTVRGRRSARPGGWHAVGALIHDLPLFLTTPLYRRWHLQWGATPAEVAAPLPGDELFPHAQFRPTRAITIAAPPELVWPWLVQVGCRRAGWYSNDLLDNLGHRSARDVIEHLQQLEVGQWIPMSPVGPPTDVNAFRVTGFEVNRWLLWTKPDSSWVWRLTPLPDGDTRLVTRVSAPRDWKHAPASALLGLLLMEFGDFAMMRRMLLGIKQRAEELSGQQASRRSPTCSGQTTGRPTSSSIHVGDVAFRHRTAAEVLATRDGSIGADSRR